MLLRAMFAEGIVSLRKKAADKLSEGEWQQLLAYAAATLQNCGNYRSFGDKKFVPQLAPEKFWAVIKASEAYSVHPRELADMYSPRSNSIR